MTKHQKLLEEFLEKGFAEGKNITKFQMPDIIERQQKYLAKKLGDDYEFSYDIDGDYVSKDRVYKESVTDVKITCKETKEEILSYRVKEKGKRIELSCFVDDEELADAVNKHFLLLVEFFEKKNGNEYLYDFWFRIEKNTVVLPKGSYVLPEPPTRFGHNFKVTNNENISKQLEEYRIINMYLNDFVSNHPELIVVEKREIDLGMAVERKTNNAANLIISQRGTISLNFFLSKTDIRWRVVTDKNGELLSNGAVKYKDVKDYKDFEQIITNEINSIKMKAIFEKPNYMKMLDINLTYGQMQIFEENHERVFEKFSKAIGFSKDELAERITAGKVVVRASFDYNYKFEKETKDEYQTEKKERYSTLIRKVTFDGKELYLVMVEIRMNSVSQDKVEYEFLDLIEKEALKEVPLKLVEKMNESV